MVRAFVARKTERRSFFPWEQRGGLFRRLGLYRLRPLLAVAGAIALLVLVVVRERDAAGVRRTRSILLDVREALDAYLADHQGQCPESFAALSVMRMARHGVLNGAARRTGTPVDDGDSTALSRCPVTRRTHMPA